MAHLTNFSFEFFMKFSQKIPLYFFYTMVQNFFFCSNHHLSYADRAKKNYVGTVNPEYFIRTQFSYPGLPELSYAWNFRTVADRCKFSDLPCTFRMHFTFVRKPPRTNYRKITCIRNILNLQYLDEILHQSWVKNGHSNEKIAEKHPCFSL